jgi:YD repeat-containing protein
VSLWRAQLDHFSTLDLNYWSPVDFYPVPPDEPADEEVDSDDEDECEGCVIHPQSGSLGQVLPLYGTGYHLHYESKRVKDYKRDQAVIIPLTGPEVGSVEAVELSMEVAGKTITKWFEPKAKLSHRFVWDGFDAYGRALKSSKLNVRVSYYKKPDTAAAGSVFSKAYAAWPVELAEGAAFKFQGRGDGEIYRQSAKWARDLSDVPPILGQANLGAWSIDVHHEYDVEKGTLYKGNGEVRRVEKIAQAPFVTVAGASPGGFSGDRGPAALAQFEEVGDIETGPDGTVYVIDDLRIRKIAPDGVINTIAGNGRLSQECREAPSAANVPLPKPRYLAISDDGSIYFSSGSLIDAPRDHCIQRITKAGALEIVAGTGERGYSGDTGLASAAKLNMPRGIAVSPFGDIYFSDSTNHVIRKISPDGVINSVAGTGVSGFSGDDGLAAKAQMTLPEDMSLDAAGRLYFFDSGNYRVRVIGRDGTIKSVAGDGTWQFKQLDENSATRATDFPLPQAKFTVDQEDKLLILSGDIVYRIKGDGSIIKIAGIYDCKATPLEQGSIYSSCLTQSRALSTSPDNGLYVSFIEYADNVSDPGGTPFEYGIIGKNINVPAIPYGESDQLIVPGKDGMEVYIFTDTGRHVETRSTLTNSVKYRFHYNSDAMLVGIEDAYGSMATIERDGSGRPKRIMSPDQQATKLEFDGNGYLRSVKDPLGHDWSMEYTTGGLLEKFTDRNANVDTYQYDDEGLLIKDKNQEGGGWTLSTDTVYDSDNKKTTISAKLASAESRTYTFEYSKQSNGPIYKRNSSPDGTSATQYKYHHLNRVTDSNGVETEVRKGPNAFFGMLTPIDGGTTVKMPSGLTYQATQRMNGNLSEPDNLLATQSIEYLTTVNNKPYKSHYDAESRAWTNTSPEGRVDSVVYDDKGKVVAQRNADNLPTTIAYDERGRLKKITRGEGDETRSTTLTYHESGGQRGYLASVTDSLGRQMAFTMDSLGQVEALTLADGRVVAYSYDKNGNLASITPPGKSAHVFKYNGVDRETGYTPPALSGVETVTTYTYNLDKQLASVLRPDGKALNLTYDDGGRLAKVVVPRGSYRYGYDTATGQVSQIEAPDGGLLDVTHDGSLPKTQQWTGAIKGHVAYGYNSDFLLQTLAVNDLSTSYSYDKDGLLTQVGELGITRDPSDGLPTRTGLGNIDSTHDYNGFEELITDSYQSQGSADIAISLNTTGITEDPLQISGLVTGAGSITVNDAPVSLGDDGTLSGSVPLPNIGKNTFTIKVYDKADKLAGEHTQDVYRTNDTKTYYITHIPAIAPNGDLYFLTEDSGIYRLPSGSGTPKQPDWLKGADDLALSSGGLIYLKKGQKISVYDGTSENSLVDLPTGLGSVFDMEIGPDDSLYLSVGNTLYRVEAGTPVVHATLPGEATTRLMLDSSTWGLVANSDYDELFYKINPDGSVEDILKGKLKFFGEGFAVDNTGKVCFDYEGIVCADSAGNTVWPDYWSDQLEFDHANLAYTVSKID